MKKSFVLLLSLLVLGIAVVCFGQTTLLAEKDQVEFIETVVYGDKSIVDGVTIEMENNYEEYLFWNSTYVIGETPQIQTDYRFYYSRQYENSDGYRGNMYFNVDYYESLDWGYWEDEYVPETGLALAMKELYEETQPGEEKSKFIYLKDYMEYYTFSFDLNSAFTEEERGTSLDVMLQESVLKDYVENGEARGYSKERVEEAKQQLEWLQMFYDFFKIPVMEQDAAVIQLKKDADGNVLGWGMATASMGSGTGEAEIPSFPENDEYDSFYMSTTSVVTNKECYFTFNPRTEKGNVVDTSQIPGGYGIYYFPFDTQKQEIYPEQLAMVYALDPQIYVYNMDLDEKHGNLLLFTMEEGIIYMSVIDIETMTLTEKFEISTEEIGIGFHKIYEDYMVVDAAELLVFEIDADGNCKKVLTAPREELNEYQVDKEGVTYLPNWDTEFDWNGEKLVFANYIFNEEHYPEASFYVAAVDETGLVYLGTYQSSLRSTHSYEVNLEYAYEYSHVRPESGNVFVKWE